MFIIFFRILFLKIHVFLFNSLMKMRLKSQFNELVCSNRISIVTEVLGSAEDSVLE
jgi:hypothetical protein